MSKFRSASHVSVYNYPEHLNPFYEDEQHKRLRFWKIKTSSKSSNENKSNGGGLRRGSFNLGSLRELFPLKSFRMKKRSSAQGVNMTSESPPPLRRDFIGYNKEDEDRYASYDPHFRHTASGVENFPRNAAYRSSLQNMNGANSGDFLTFNRNNRYRSTIQNGLAAKNDRYVYSGSMTPQPKSRYLTDITPRMTPGSSMNSVSTNPFEDEEDEIEEHVELSASNTLEVTKKVQRAPKPSRKKRQAPPPPSQKQMLGANPADEEVELRGAERDGLEELSRMTREFENFVKHTNDDGKNHEPRILLNGEEMQKHETIEKSEKVAEVQKTPSTESSEKNSNAKVSVEITIQNDAVDVVEEHKSTTMLIENEADELETKQVIQKAEIIQQNSPKKIKVAPRAVEIKEHEFQRPQPIPLEIKTTDIRATEVKIIELKAPQAETSQIRNIDEQKNTSLPPCQIEIVEEKQEAPRIVINEILKIDEPQIHVKESSPTIETITSEVQQLLTEIRSFPEFQRLTPTPTPSREETPEFIPMTVREKFHVKLRIDEDEIAPQTNLSKEQVYVEKEIKKEVPQSGSRIIRDTTPIPLARTEVEEKLSSQGFRKVTKSEFLKIDENEHVEIRRKDSDELIIREGDEPPKVPERRRSVKEIIESINKHQQKLKINQPPTPQFERKFYYGDSQKFSYHEKPAVPSKENVLLKLKRTEDHERRVNELLEDLQGYSSREVSTFKTQKFPLTDRDSNNNNNISFPNHKSDDVNPIPKPRRVL